MAEICKICGNKIGLMQKVKLQDGVVCGHCASICSSVKTESINNLKKYWDISNERFRKFSKTHTLKSMFSEVINIDAKNGLIIIGKLEKITKPPIVFSFDEVESYNFEVEGAKTVTKKKGGITRAVVGGVVAGPVRCNGRFRNC